MFDKLKQLQKAREIQNNLKNKEVKIEENGFLIIVDGSFNIKELKINESFSKEEQEFILKSCLNKAMQEAQIMAVREISQAGNFGI